MLCARSRTRSLLTMLGIVWGIVAVTLLIAYGSGFPPRAGDMPSTRSEEHRDLRGRQQTSEQPGGQRAGKASEVRTRRPGGRAQAEATMVKHACLETVKWLPIAYGDRLANTAIRGVCPEYGEMRNEVPPKAAGSTPSDEVERRRVVFLGLQGEGPAL